MSNILALNKAIRQLKGSPLFYLFLSSRELFHTNFWYWLSTLNKVETLRLFSDYVPTSGQLIYKREHNQRIGNEKSKVDLLISDGSNPLYVIENKVKDFPTLSQLNRIRSSFDNSSIRYVLITLFSSPEIAFKGWEMRTYRNISESIVPENFTVDRYYRSLISDYKSFCLNLDELAESLPITCDYDFSITHNKDLFQTLNEIKLWEGYQKLRASHLLHHFDNIHGIRTGYEINNQKATIVFFVELEGSYEIGITVEDAQFRKYIGGKKIEVFAQNLLSNELYFSNEFKGRGNKAFLKYDNPGDKQYRYQYEKLGNSVSFLELFEKICIVIADVMRQKSAIECCLPTE